MSAVGQFIAMSSTDVRKSAALEFCENWILNHHAAKDSINVSTMMQSGDYYELSPPPSPSDHYSVISGKLFFNLGCSVVIYLKFVFVTHVSF